MWWGETLPHYTWGTVSDAAVARVQGGNPADFLGDDSLGCGLQMALYDVVGKALGVPAYRLFNLPKVRAGLRTGGEVHRRPEERIPRHDDSVRVTVDRPAVSVGWIGVLAAALAYVHPSRSGRGARHDSAAP